MVFLFLLLFLLSLFALEGEHPARVATPVHRALLRPYRRPAENAPAHPHGVLYHRPGQGHPRQEAEGVSKHS